VVNNPDALKPRQEGQRVPSAQGGDGVRRRGKPAPIPAWGCAHFRPVSVFRHIRRQRASKNPLNFLPADGSHSFLEPRGTTLVLMKEVAMPVSAKLLETFWGVYGLAAPAAA